MRKVIIAIIAIFTVVLGCNLDFSQNQKSQTEQIEDINKHNERIANTPLNEMKIECKTDASFFLSLDEMKNKLSETDKKNLNQAIGTIAESKNFKNKKPEDNPFCTEFNGYTVARFFQEAEAIRNKAKN